MKPAIAATLLSAAFTLLGCRKVLGVDDFGTRSTYTGKIDGYNYVSRLCRDCVDEHCEGPAAACDADPRCAAQARCVALCGVTDHDCRGRCSVSTPSTEKMAALVACQAAHCGESLPEAGRCAGSLVLHGNAECDRCLGKTSQCRGALQTVSKNGAAIELQRCEDACRCHGECRDRAPGCDCPADDEASRQVNELANCCAGQCGRTAPDWSCIGRVTSPVSTSLSLDLRLRVTTPIVQDQAMPIPKLRVRACSALEAANLVHVPTGDCESSAPDMTNDDGWAELTIVRLPDRDRYFDLLRLTSEEDTYSAPALFYFFPPIRETPTWVARRMVARNLADDVLRQVPELTADWQENGGIVFSARSCNGASGEGLQIVSKSGLDVHYLSEGSVVDTDATKTSSSGFGFLANVPPGPHDLEARLPSGELVGEYSVIVVPGSLTHIVLEPTPLGDAE